MILSTYYLEDPSVRAANSRLAHETGFTLAELVIVLLIVGLLLSGLLVPLSAQVETKRVSDTQRILDNAREALLGFAVINGRLPCPASASSNGLESFCTAAIGACTATTIYQAHGVCSNPFDGFLPAASLGFTPTDSQGYAVDAWALSPSNRIRYAVANTQLDVLSPPSLLTSKTGLKTAGITAATGKTYLLVCPTATGIVKTPGAPSCGAVKLTDTAPAVIYSLGKNAPTAGTGADEAENPNPQGGSVDAFFVSHTPAPATNPNGEFDDLVTWLSLNTLISRMVAAGQLP